MTKEQLKDMLRLIELANNLMFSDRMNHDEFTEYKEICSKLIPIVETKLNN